jgi:hypothetical protein
LTQKRLIIGQRSRHIPAGTINYALESLDRLERLVGHAPGCPQSLTGAESPCLVALAYNTSDTDFVERAPAGVVNGSFTLPEIDTGEDDGEFAKDAVFLMPTVNIDTPDAALHSGKLCITLEPIKAGKSGLVAILGLICCRVDYTDAAHKCAALKDGDRVYLKSASSGFSIWARGLEDETGDATLGKQWALVMIGGGAGGGEVNFKRAKSVSAISAATGWAVDEAGTGDACYVAADGTFGDSFTVKSNYFDELPANHPGWIFSDGTDLWFVNMGCNAGPGG